MRTLLFTSLTAALLATAGCPKEAEPDVDALLAEVEAELEAARPKFSRRSAQALADKRSAPPKSLEEQLADHVRTEVKVGYADREAIIESGVDLFGSDLPEDEATEERLAALESQVRAIAAAELRAHAEAEKSWKTPTHPDLLSRVFADLEKSGIVARERFSCCQSCGVDEIYDEMELLQEEGKRVKGYTFFHDQDIEYVLEDRTIHLSYGSLSEDEADAVKVGQRIAAALRKKGFTVEWSGLADDRIGITGLDWKKRRDSSAPGG